MSHTEEMHPTQSPWNRVVADSGDRVAWLRARAMGVTATDAAKLASPNSIASVAQAKLHGSRFHGNSAYLEYGRRREPAIARWVTDNHGIDPCGLLFRSHTNPRHLATPDGLAVSGGGLIELAEIKTTTRPWRSIPRAYLRQVWWQQHVVGAERTLLVWEQHENFVPSAAPRSTWVYRDEEQIATLVSLADQLIARLHQAAA